MYTTQPTEYGTNYISFMTGDVSILPYTESKCVDCEHFHTFSTQQRLQAAKLVDHTVKPYKTGFDCFFDKNAAADAVVSGCKLINNKYAASGAIAELTKKLYESGETSLHNLLLRLSSDEVLIYKLDNFDDICKAVILNLAVLSGVSIGGNLISAQLRSNGIAELPNVIVGKRPVVISGLKKIDNQWTVKAGLGWGNKWGNDGFCYLMKEHWNEGYGCKFEAYAVYGRNAVKDKDSKEIKDATRSSECHDDHVVS